MKFYKITFYRIQMLQVHSTLLLLALLNLLTLSVNSNGKMNGHRDGKATSFIKVYGLRACTESRSVILWNNNKFLILNDLIFDMLLAALRHRFSLCSI